VPRVSQDLRASSDQLERLVVLADLVLQETKAFQDLPGQRVPLVCQGLKGQLVKMDHLGLVELLD